MRGVRACVLPICHMAAPLYKMRRLLLPLLLASTTAAKSTYWKEVEAKKRRPAAAAYCPKRCFTTEASGDEKREVADLTCCSSAQGTIFELAAFVAATTETAVRGFSLGFGYVLVKATLRAADRDEGPRSGHDFGPAYRFARMAGLGVACSFVGLSMFVPVGLRLGHRLA